MSLALDAPAPIGFGEKLEWARRDLKGARSGLRSKSKLLEAR